MGWTFTGVGWEKMGQWSRDIMLWSCGWWGGMVQCVEGMEVWCGWVGFGWCDGVVVWSCG